MVRVLCEAVAEWDQAGQDGARHLFMASKDGHRPVVRAFCEAEAAKGQTGQEPRSLCLPVAWDWGGARLCECLPRAA